MLSWETLRSTELLHRPPWLTVCEETVRLPNGIELDGYLLSSSRDYAMCFALMPDGTVPLVRQYKHGIRGLSYDLPAGYLDSPMESPLAAAQRELQEEAGLSAADWHSLGHLLIDTNRGPTRAHLYLARSVIRSGTQQLDPTEALEVSFHSVADLRTMVQRGEIDSLSSTAGIMLAFDALTHP